MCVCVCVCSLGNRYMDVVMHVEEERNHVHYSSDTVYLLCF